MPYLIVLEAVKPGPFRTRAICRCKRLLQWSSDGRRPPGAPVPRWPAREALPRLPECVGDRQRREDYHGQVVTFLLEQVAAQPCAKPV